MQLIEMLTAPTQVTTAPASIAATTRKPWWSAVLPVLMWQLAALLFVEFVLFCAGIGEEEIFKFDKDLGFRHFPNKIVTWRSEGYARSYFDADGMREPGLTISKPANTYRVALLGDSEVESLQVPIEKTYGQMIEKNSALVNGKKVQVLNFGNSGYSTTQECMLMEEKVFKYQPDLVILGYSNRDMMENWSPPDETLSNVRPAALQLPGRPLIIDNSPVVNWLKSPRARFLQSIEIIRQHSRVWGIISATELQLSMKDPAVKTFLAFCTNPVRSSRAWFRAAKSFVTTTVAASHARSPVAAPPPVIVAAAPLPASVSSGSVSSATVPVVVANPKSVGGSPTVAAISPTIAQQNTGNIPDPAEKNQYTRLVAATMGGLIARMDKDCSDHHAKFMVVGMPCRMDLAPFGGSNINPDITYQDELTILTKLCSKTGVSFVDTNSPARVLSLKERESLFFSSHLAPAGHNYMSQQLIAPVRESLISL